MKRAMFAAATLAFAAGCAISHADEIQMGQEYARQVESELPMVLDPQVNQYVTTLGNAIARPADTQGFSWSFRVVDSREVNAFALPGGHVYVTRGLIARTATTSELAGVLGHEIAHVTRRHAVQQLERAQQANVGLSLACVLTGICEGATTRAAIEIGGAAVFAHYSREDEREADRDAVDNVVRAGISPRGLPELFRKLIAERERQPGTLDAWFSTHPTEESRIADVEKEIAKVHPTRLAVLLVDSPAFQDVRRRLAALPIARAP
jgi:predicted Zn-dependent protease